METPSPKVKDFTQMETWKKARLLRSAVYHATQTFPREELYGLAAQMRRAACSITANLAEGYGRFSYQQNVQFCRHSRGSACELRDHLTTALDARYWTREKFLELNGLAMDVIRLVSGCIRSTQKRLREKEGSRRNNRGG